MTPVKNYGNRKYGIPCELVIECDKGPFVARRKVLEILRRLEADGEIWHFLTGDARGR